MKQQIIVIHGGDCFDTHEKYMAFLQSFEIDSIEYFKGKDWKATLQERLGSGYEVIAPRMPNALNARYAEWSIWFEKLIPFLTDGVILIGHSLGGTFLAKYLSEKKLPVTIAATFLLGAPFDDEGSDESLVDFALPQSLSLFGEQGGKIFVYHSADDPVVDYFQQRKFLKALPHALPITFDGRGHFRQEEFPELIKDIRSVE